MLVPEAMLLLANGGYEMASRETKPGCNHGLEAIAIAAEQAGVGPIAWRSKWDALKAGALQFVHAFATPERYYLLLTDRVDDRSEVAAAYPADCSAVRFVESWLRGTSPKVLAIESGLHPSTIGYFLHRGLQRLGIACTPTRVPAVVGVLVAAAAGTSPLDPGRAARLEYQSRSYLVLGVARPEALLSGYVPPAEYTTLCMLAEGSSYAQIARVRRVASRTVANQVASLFRRLGVSGRLELQQLLVRFAAGDRKPLPLPRSVSGTQQELRAQ
jgi:DNA-binding CsgD family transcriptional regulator